MRNNQATVQRFFKRLVEDFPKETAGWCFDVTERNTYRLIKKEITGSEIYIFGVTTRNAGEMIRFLDSIHTFFYLNFNLWDISS